VVALSSGQLSRTDDEIAATSQVEEGALKKNQPANLMLT
jgi:hypothetical protein